MRSFIYSIAVVLLFNVNCLAQTYGLTFSSHEAVLEKRTALDLSPDDSLCFSKNFDLGFDLNFVLNHQIYFGYVLRIINGENGNIDLMYDQKASLFRIIKGEKFSGISFMVDSARIFRLGIRLNISVNLENNVLECFLDGKSVGKTPINVVNPCFRFLWGANDFHKFRTRDLPPMQIRNIKITEQEKLKYYWPLDEIQGEICTDRIGGRQAKVKNPGWIKPKHQIWELTASFTLNGYGSVAFDAKKDLLYIAGSDTMAIYSTASDPPGVNFIINPHQDLRIGHQTIYDTVTDKLYDIYIDRKKVVPFDLKTNQWKENFEIDTPVTEFWQANKFVSPSDSSLYVVAGYGQLKYKNQVSRYHLPTKSWEQVKTTGDSLSPRYLAALGTTSDGSFAYILGGYGSHTGDQMLDPNNYYDMYRYDVKNKSFKKLYNLKTTINQFTFANSLVIDSVKGEYYALLFPNDVFNSRLQLIKGSLNDSTFQLLGNPIDYSFHDIQSFADLFYSPVSNKLIAVTLFYSKFDLNNKSTQVRIYTVDFPPEVLNENPVPVSKGFSRFFIPFSILAALLFVGFLLFRNRFKKPTPKTEGVLTFDDHTENAETFLATDKPNHETDISASIFLFGQFQVFDKKGNDITRVFTPLLKELLLIITVYTIKNGRGISSEGLNEILWNDKSEKDAKNNRSVNLAKLKIFLEKVGDCVINKEGGFWQLQVKDPEVYIDYLSYTSIIQNNSNPLSKESVEPLFQIIKRGPFLLETEYPWLDNTKSALSSQIIDRCLGYLGKLDIKKDAECFIDVSNYIFFFDPLNEDALSYKCKSLVFLKRHNLSHNTYLKFIKEFKSIYGEDFGKSFNDIIA